MNIKETKKNIIQAGHKAVEELVKVAKEAIVDSGDDITADRLKNAAATKKLAIFDAFEILNRIQEEESLLEGKAPEETKGKNGNMDMIKNMILSLYQKPVRLVKSLRLKTYELLCPKCQCEYTITKKTNG